MEDETITKQIRFFPNKSDDAWLAGHSFTLLKPRNNLHPVLCIFYSLGSLRYVSLMGLLDSVNGHLWKLLSAQASKTLYFYIAPPLKAASVHFVIQFFIDYLKGSRLGDLVGKGQERGWTTRFLHWPGLPTRCSCQLIWPFECWSCSVEEVQTSKTRWQNLSSMNR